ncbi:MAG: hypothetical protein ABIT96_07445 [Ferruginibacter sp.]
MKYIVVFILISFFYFTSGAQVLSPADARTLQKKEDSLKIYAVQILQGINPSDRFLADSNFTKSFVRALKTRNSFYYPFDSLYTISKLYAPDSSFRIYTWQMIINENIIRQHGAIQMRTDDGSLKLFPLIDKSDVTINIPDTVAGNTAWMGAVYYKVIQKKFQNKNYYTLLGFDENNIRTTKKLIEVLYFPNGLPVFGGRYFNAGGLSKKVNARYIMEYKKDASPRLTWDPELDMIVVEHLVSESGEPAKKWTMIGDGDYDGFKWTNGSWTFVNKLFNEVTPEGKPPMPAPLRDDKGNIDPAKLKDLGEDPLPVVPAKKP